MNSRVGRPVRLLVLGAAALVLLSGCIAPTPSEQPEPINLLCTWTSVDSGARVTLSIDGALEFSDLPLSIARNDGTFDPDHSGELISGQGRWQLGDGLYLRDDVGRPQISLEFPTGEGSAEIAVFFVRQVQSGWELYALYGDIDNRQQFAFSPEDCLPEPRAG